MLNYNKLLDTNDCINFGQQNGETFKWIYLLDITYLVWLIEETDICFIDLNLFYSFGKPKIMDESKTSKEALDNLSALTKKIGRNIYNSGSSKYKITIDILAFAIESKIIIPEHFISRDFKFEQKTIDINDSKVLKSKPYYNGINSNRDLHLTKLFKFNNEKF